MRRYGWLVIVLAFLIALLPACAKKEVAPPPVEEPIEEEPPPPPPPLEEEEPEVEEAEPIELGDVFFDYDKSVIKEEYKGVLRSNGEILMSRPEVMLLVEGHCDERGTNEYNIALGERRAKSVVDFLVAYGIPKSRLTMISYGEERPFAAGHNEAAWAQNRRAHMVIK